MGVSTSKSVTHLTIHQSVRRQVAALEVAQVKQTLNGGKGGKRKGNGNGSPFRGKRKGPRIKETTSLTIEINILSTGFKRSTNIGMIMLFSIIRIFISAASGSKAFGNLGTGFGMTNFGILVNKRADGYLTLHNKVQTSCIAEIGLSYHRGTIPQLF